MRSEIKRLTLPNGKNAITRPLEMVLAPLQLVLARGHHWLNMLDDITKCWSIRAQVGSESVGDVLYTFSFR